MLLSQKDADFAHAMALKLRLNREARAKREEELRLRKKYGDFRYAIASDCVSGHKKSGTAGPGLTIASVLKDMDAWGF